MFKKLILTASIVALSACGGSDGDNKNEAVDSSNKIPDTTQDNDNVFNASNIRVIDGDTVEITLNNKPSERIRLLGIDAPEKNQPYGAQSTAQLERCVDVGSVKVEWTGKDRYDRYIGKVIAAGVDCNYKQVEDGYAWHYKQYQDEQTETDRISYANAEMVAKAENRGLWADCAIAPWDWRKGLRSCDDSTLQPTTPVPTEPSTPNTPFDPDPANPFDSVDPEEPQTPESPVDNTCAALRTKTCGQIANCTEAYTALSCGNNRIDGDKDGIPCESICR